VIEKLINSTISGCIGGITSAIISVLAAAYTVPMPIDRTHHVVGYGINGFICGMVSAFMAVLIHMKRAERKP
jgi:hypothetical protein